MKKPAKRGRPPKEKSAMMNPITVRFPPAMMNEIEALISERLDQPDKGQVIRELVAKGIAVTKAEKQRS